MSIKKTSVSTLLTAAALAGVIAGASVTAHADDTKAKEEKSACGGKGKCKGEKKDCKKGDKNCHAEKHDEKAEAKPKEKK